MLTLGIDIGSRSVKTVLFDAATGMVRHSAIRDVSPDPARDAQSALAHTLAEAGITAQCIARTVSTGYGRYSVPFASASATEITCHAEGVAALFPDARLVIDIGGQDSKVIRLSAGKVRDFAMNDRCAAGTGRFLEVAARILDTTVDGMAELAERATEHPDISSMCVVFAESEILGMIAKGVRPADIALGLHIALARRVTGLVQRCGVDSPVVFTGGVALNRAMARALGSELKDRVSVADEPRLTGALGAALIAARALGAAAVLRSSEGLGRKPAASKCAPVPCPVPAPASACSCECASPARPAPCAGSGSVKQTARQSPDLHSVPSLAHFERMIPNCIDTVNQARREGRKIVSIFCEYTPREIIMAAGAVPVCMCGGSNRTAKLAEAELPSNLCPLIKSSYGYLLDGSSPLFEASDFVVAETTCDGKKKMYELLGRSKPMHILELTQKPGEDAAWRHWLAEVQLLRQRMEELTGNRITDESLRSAIRRMNEERQLRLEISQWAGRGLTGREVLLCKSSVSCTDDDIAAYRRILSELEAKGEQQDGKPRILLTGVPLPHGAEKVMDIIERAGATVVVQENCTGIKPLYEMVSEDGDPLEAIARKYFALPCSCMMPNTGRFDLIRGLIASHAPDGVIDLVWQACHTYNVEAVALHRMLAGLDMPYMKIETDYSPSDIEQIRLRVESFIAMIAGRR